MNYSPISNINGLLKYYFSVLLKITLQSIFFNKLKIDDENEPVKT